MIRCKVVVLEYENCLCFDACSIIAHSLEQSSVRDYVHVNEASYYVNYLSYHVYCVHLTVLANYRAVTYRLSALSILHPIINISSLIICSGHRTIIIVQGSHMEL